MAHFSKFSIFKALYCRIVVCLIKDLEIMNNLMANEIVSFKAELQIQMQLLQNKTHNNLIYLYYVSGMYHKFDCEIFLTVF